MHMIGGIFNWYSNRSSKNQLALSYMLMGSRKMKPSASKLMISSHDLVASIIWTGWGADEEKAEGKKGNSDGTSMAILGPQ